MRGIKLSIIILFVLVLLSLGLNAYLVSQLMRVQQQTQSFAREVRPVFKETITEAINDLEEIQGSTIEFEVTIDDEFPVNVDIPINEQMNFPIEVTVPIRQEITTTAMMSLFEGGIEVPVDIAVPVDVEVPIDVVVPLEIDQTVSLSTTVPVNIDVPVAIVVDETDLAAYIDQLRTALVAFEAAADQLLLELE